MPTDVIELEANTARSLASLLELLSEVPSTPESVASEAAHRAGLVNERLPDQPRQAEAGVRPLHGVVILERAAATAVAGLLELLAGLPSTSPGVAEEAAQHAANLWDQLG